MIHRFSSRRPRLEKSFLTAKLVGAKACDRIAGYFCGSILETAVEALDSVTGKIRVACNSNLPHRTWPPPVYRKLAGLWKHQTVFVKLAFDAHLRNPGAARFIFADQVGLGQTVQLAVAAELMALAGEKPELVLAPKTLLWQWQD